MRYYRKWSGNIWTIRVSVLRERGSSARRGAKHFGEAQRRPELLKLQKSAITTRASVDETTGAQHRHTPSSPAMAAIRSLSAPPLLRALLPLSYAPFRPALALPALGQFPRYSLLSSITVPIPLAAIAGLSSIFDDLWESILRAVPKKKTSHMKKRQRQMASGKHLKDVTELNKCSGCGRVKRAHVLCPFCVQCECSYWV